MTTGLDLVRWELTHVGAEYIWGATGPKAWDCSGFQVDALRHNGHNVPRYNAAGFYNLCKERGTLISVAEARGIPGAYGFVILRNGHVEHIVASLGNGSDVEAANHKDGVGVFRWDGRFQAAGLFPDVDFSNHPTPAPVPPPPAPVDWAKLRRELAFTYYGQLQNVPAPLPVGNPIFVAIVQNVLNLVIPTANITPSGHWDDRSNQQLFDFQVSINKLKPGTITDATPGEFSNETKLWLLSALHNIAAGG